MNANTALKINDAVDQAVRCGESLGGILAQVERAFQRALVAQQERVIEQAQKRIAELNGLGRDEA